MHYSCGCGDAGVNRPTELPVVCKYSTYSYLQYIIRDNDNKYVTGLCIYYIMLFVFILDYSFYL